MSVDHTNPTLPAWQKGYGNFAKFIAWSTVLTLLLTVVALALWMVLVPFIYDYAPRFGFDQLATVAVTLFVGGLILFALPVIVIAVVVFYPVWVWLIAKLERSGVSRPKAQNANPKSLGARPFVWPYLWYIWPISIFVGPWMAAKVYKNV